MITGLDHFLILTADIDAGVAAYETLLGCLAVSRHEDDGAAMAVFDLGNTCVELVSPIGDTGLAPRLREILETDGEGLKSIAFGTDDLEGEARTLERRGLSPGDITQGARLRRFRLSDERMAGLKAFVVEPKPSDASVADLPGAVSGLDHIVVTTPNPDRAAALYGARLDLPLRLDRTIEQFSTRFLFFKTGGVIFEVVSSTRDGVDPSSPDSLMGLTYKTQDLDAAHQRLTEAGLDVSDMRKGRKPGSRVFTVRDHTLGVPTLFISHERG